jgi:hypothetical protein
MGSLKHAVGGHHRPRIVAMGQRMCLLSDVGNWQKGPCAEQMKAHRLRRHRLECLRLVVFTERDGTAIFAGRLLLGI